METSDHVLQDAALSIAAGGPLPTGVAWFERLLEQIDCDRAADIFSRWSESTVIDSNAEAAVVDRAVMQRFSEVAGTAINWPVVNAGLAHTYGYLLSGVPTPYGLKRERWVSGQMAQALGVDTALFSADPPVGTLLSNVTAALDALTLGCPAPDWLSGGEFDVVCLTEVDAEADLEARTWFFSRPDCESSVLVYTIRSAGGEARNLTTFPVDHAYRATTLERATDRTNPLALRYNADGVRGSGSPAHRCAESFGTKAF